MALIVDENFEGPANGVAFTTGNSTCDEIYGTAGYSFTASTAEYVDQTEDGNPGYVKSGHVVLAAQYAGMEFNVANRAATYVSVYFKMATVPTGTSCTILEVRDATNTTQIAQLNVSTTSTIRIRNVSTALSGAQTIAANQWYRVDWTLGSSTQSARMYTGANLHSTDTADGVSLGSGACGSGLHGEVWLGASTATTVNYYVDRLKVDDAALPAPVVADIPAGITSTAPSVAAGVGVPTPFASGSVQYLETFEGATSGTTATASTTIADAAYSGGTGSSALIHDAAQFISTPNSLHLTTTTMWRTLEVQPASSRTNTYISAYIRLVSYPSVNTYILELRDPTTPATILSQLGITTAGALRIRDTTATARATSSALTLNQWYRLDWSVTSSTLTIKLYTGNALNDSNTANAWWAPAAVSHTTGATQNVIIGSTIASTFEYYMDHLQIDNTALPTPFGGGGGTPGGYPAALGGHPVRVFNGSTWTGDQGHAVNTLSSGGDWEQHPVYNVDPATEPTGVTYGYSLTSTSEYTSRIQATGMIRPRIMRIYQSSGDVPNLSSSWFTQSDGAGGTAAVSFSWKPNYAVFAAGTWVAGFKSYVRANIPETTAVYATAWHEPEGSSDGGMGAGQTKAQWQASWGAGQNHLYQACEDLRAEGFNISSMVCFTDWTCGLLMPNVSWRSSYFNWTSANIITSWFPTDGSVQSHVLGFDVYDIGPVKAGGTKVSHMYMTSTNVPKPYYYPDGDGLGPNATAQQQSSYMIPTCAAYAASCNNGAGIPWCVPEVSISRNELSSDLGTIAWSTAVRAQHHTYMREAFESVPNPPLWVAWFQYDNENGRSEFSLKVAGNSALGYEESIAIINDTIANSPGLTGVLP